MAENKTEPSAPLKIWASPYTLQAKGSLSGKAVSRERYGAILRVESMDGEGFADLHPWVELGDLSLSQQLDALGAGATTLLSARSLQLAALDREARVRGSSAFADLQIPKSHYLVTDLEPLTEKELEQAWLAGFRTLKIKMGRKIETESQRCLQLETALAAFRLRLDFNATQTASSALALISLLPESLRQAIEFIEDPCAWEPEAWKRIRSAAGTPLALDRIEEAEGHRLGVDAGEPHQGRQSSRQDGVGSPIRASTSTSASTNTDSDSNSNSGTNTNTNTTAPAFDWLIFKPALQSPDWIRALAKAQKPPAQVCVTSYLDHPVGQMGAALEAARWVNHTSTNTHGGPSLGTCGLLSQVAYQPNAFSEAMVIQGPNLLPTPGTGIGFDDLLASLQWTKVQG